MESKAKQTDAQWYCRTNTEEEYFYDIFFSLCKKYHINWGSATEKERAFIEEVTRVTYEREKAQRLGLSVETIRPCFAS